MTTDRQTFYADAQKRLLGVTDDPAALEAFERLSEAADRRKDTVTSEALGVFCAEVWRLGLSLDYIFCGKGEPFRA